MNFYSLLFMLLFNLWWSPQLDNDSYYNYRCYKKMKDYVNYTSIINSNDYTEHDIYNLYEIYLKIDKNFRAILKHITYELQIETKEHIWLNHASLKSTTSLRRKLKFDRNNKLDLIDDIVRGSVIFETEKSMSLFRKKLNNYYLIHAEIDNFKNSKRFKAFFLKLSDRFSEKYNNNQILIELQLHFCGTFLVQKYTHHLYKVLSNLKILSSNMNDNLGEIKLNTDIYNSIHPYFILIAFEKKCEDNKMKCKVSRKEVLMKENGYWLRKTLDSFKKIDYLKRYIFYEQMLKLVSIRYNILVKFREIGSHKRFANDLDRILQGLYTIAFRDKNRCEYNLLNTIEYYY